MSRSLLRLGAQLAGSRRCVETSSQRLACFALLSMMACSKPPPSDFKPGSVAAKQFVTATDAGMRAKSISVVFDQQPRGSRSTLAVSATEITRSGTLDRFAQQNVACPNQLMGSCLVTDCTSLKDVREYPYGTVNPAAVGKVVVKGAQHTESFAGDGGTRLRVVQSMGPMFAQGEVVKVSSGGDATPAFDREVLMPRAVTLLAPLTEGPLVPLKVSRNQALDVKWSALPEKSPEVVAVSVSDNVRTVTCRFDASAGRASMTPDVLSLLAPGPGFLMVHTLWAHDEAIGGWLISTFARHVATHADGGTASFPTLELE